jgi:hypothetical protein
MSFGTDLSSQFDIRVVQNEIGVAAAKLEYVFLSMASACWRPRVLPDRSWSR